MLSKIFTEYRDEIKGYCVRSGLSFDNLLKSPYCYGEEDLIFLYHDPEKAKLGLLDDTPSPSTLEIYLENGKLRFVQTDITHKYLGVDRKTEKPAVAKKPASRELAFA